MTKKEALEKAGWKATIGRPRLFDEPMVRYTIQVPVSWKPLLDAVGPEKVRKLLGKELGYID